MDDSGLLRRYADFHSDEAFAALVQRYINLVYSVALRQVNHPQNAEEITQAVFIILAKKAAGLRHDRALSSWLFQTTRLTANNFIRSEIRRRHRDEEAHMQTALNESSGELWPKIAPLLDEAVAGLREKERRAIVCRFYEGRSLREVGLALGATEEAAKKRVSRGLEKLRGFFTRRGISSTTAIIAGAVSANSVHAAPVGLAATISASALAKGTAAGSSTLTLVKGALKIMAWTKAKTAIVAGTAVLLTAGTTTGIIVKKSAERNFATAQKAEASLFTSKTELTDADNANYQKLTGTTPAEMAQTFFDACAKEDWSAVGKFWPDRLEDRTKKYLSGMETVSLGKPFKARISIAALLELQPNLRSQLNRMGNQKDFQGPQVYVPYEIRFKDGEVKKWQLAIRCDNPEHRWYFDGGL